MNCLLIFMYELLYTIPNKTSGPSAGNARPTLSTTPNERRDACKHISTGLAACHPVDGRCAVLYYER